MSRISQPAVASAAVCGRCAQEGDHGQRPLLRARRERPCRRAAESGNEFAPSNAHLPLPCGVRAREPFQTRFSTARACGPRLWDAGQGPFAFGSDVQEGHGLKVHPHVAAIGPTLVGKRLRESRDARLINGIVFVARHEHADASSRWLPSPWRDPPCTARARRRFQDLRKQRPGAATARIGRHCARPVGSAPAIASP